MSYEKDMKASWDEYATRMTIEHDREEALEKGIEKGREEKSIEMVKNLLSAKKFSIEEIANFANVPEAFVLKVKKNMK